MRSFIALELSKEIKDELGRLQDELKEAGADVKWVKPENIHLTLKFLGDIDERKLGDIKKTLAEVASKFAPFEVSLFKLGAFPTLDRPRVIWAGISKGCSEVEALAASLDSAPNFSAHVTLGRVRSGKNKAELKERLLALEPKEILHKITCVALFESTLTPSGPIYVERGRFALEIGIK